MPEITVVANETKDVIDTMVTQATEAYAALLAAGQEKKP
jgi:hypothetical protein